MADKKAHSTSRIVLNIEAELKQEFKRLCKEKGVTISSQAIDMIETWVRLQNLRQGIRNAIENEDEVIDAKFHLPDEIAEIGKTSKRYVQNLYAAVALASIIVDKEVKQSEIEALPRILKTMTPFEDCNDNEILQIAEHQLTELSSFQTSRVQKFIEKTIRSIPLDMYDELFQVALFIVEADGTISEEEKNLLLRLETHKHQIQAEDSLRVKLLASVGTGSLHLENR